MESSCVRGGIEVVVRGGIEVFPTTGVVGAMKLAAAISSESGTSSCELTTHVPDVPATAHRESMILGAEGNVLTTTARYVIINSSCIGGSALVGIVKDAGARGFSAAWLSVSE